MNANYSQTNEGCRMRCFKASGEKKGWVGMKINAPRSRHWSFNMIHGFSGKTASAKEINVM